MGLDELHLRVLAASSEDAVERSNAKKGVSSSAELNRNVGHTTTFSPKTSHEGPPLGTRGTLLSSNNLDSRLTTIRSCCSGMS